MKRTSRVLAAVVAAAALTFTGMHTADAKPAHAGSHAKAGNAAKADRGSAAKTSATKLARDVARLQEQLDRTIRDGRLARLDAEHAEGVVANVEADKTALAAILTRAELRAFRVENYRLVVNILRQATKAEANATEAGSAEALALVDSAVAKALLVTASSAKADVKAARADLSAALELLEPEGGETELEEPAANEPAVTEPGETTAP